MFPTDTPGIYKRGSRYVVVWQHRGQQHKRSYRTLSEALEAKGRRQAGDRRPATRRPLDEYALEWVAGYTGRTSRGLTEDARREYRRALKQHILRSSPAGGSPTSSRPTCVAWSATWRRTASLRRAWSRGLTQRRRCR
jgi:hypothetical protein